MNHEEDDLTKDHLPCDYLDAEEANREFWEHDHDHDLYEFWRPFDGNLVDHSSNHLVDSILMAILALSCFTFGWFLSAIIFS